MATKQSTPTPDPIVEEPPIEQPTPVAPPIAINRIKVNRTYQGARTGEVAIIPSIYLESDPLLMGLGQWLIDNQYAERYA